MIPTKLHLIIRFTHFVEETLLVALMAVFILVACGQILLRNFFEVTLLWADALIRHLVLWCGFLGAVIATRMDKHIRIDALLRLLTPRQRRWIDWFTDFISACVCGLLAWISIGFLQNEIDFDTHTFFDLETWKLQLIFPLTFFWMSLRFALRTIVNLTKESETLT